MPAQHEYIRIDKSLLKWLATFSGAVVLGIGSFIWRASAEFTTMKNDIAVMKEKQIAQTILQEQVTRDIMFIRAGMQGPLRVDGGIR